MSVYGAEWWDWAVWANRLGRVAIGRAYWSTSRAGRTMYVARFEVETIGLDGVE